MDRLVAQAGCLFSRLAASMKKTAAREKKELDSWSALSKLLALPIGRVVSFSEN